MGYIYKITYTVSGKCYIGQTGQKTPEHRWKGHRCLSKSSCPAIYNAIKKYGIDKFKFEVLIICFDEDRFIYEKEYIQKYNSLVPNGYNILEGGNDTYQNKDKDNKVNVYEREMSEETKNKIRESVFKYYRNNTSGCNIEKHREAMTKAVGRKIAQYNIKGELIKEYISIREADRLSGVKKSNIQHVLSGKNKTAGGYIWEYVSKRT
jgi:group I intron endonuclease